MIPAVLDLENPVNVFLTVSRYFKPWAITPLLKTLGGLYVDVDCYKFGITAEDAWKELQETDFLERYGIPEPTLVTFSGAGLYLHWILESAGAEAYRSNQKIYQKCEKRLGEIFDSYASDKGAQDPTRWLRIDGSTHHRTGATVHSIEVGKESFSLAEMAKALDIKEPTRSKVSRLSINSKPSHFYKDLSRWAFLRMVDLANVNEDLGGFTEGYRNTALLAYVTAGRVAGKTDMDIEAESYEFNQGFNPPLSEGEVFRVVRSITVRRGTLNDMGKRSVHSTKTLIGLLGIPDEQQRRLHLRTLIGSMERERRKQVAWQTSTKGKRVLAVFLSNPGISEMAIGMLAKVSQPTVSRALQGAGFTPNHKCGRKRKKSVRYHTKTLAV